MSKRNGMQIITLSEFWAAERLLWIPRIMFITDGGEEMGMGHVYNCSRITKKIESMCSVKIQFLMTLGRAKGIYKILEDGFQVALHKKNDIATTIKQIQVFSPS